jgi:hypothetical protein
MKKLILLSVVLLSYSVHAQKWGFEAGVGYVYANPLGGMGRIIDRAHGVNTNVGLVHPGRAFVFGVELSYAQYGRDKSEQEYTFDDGSTAPMDIIVSNSFINVMGYSRWYLALDVPLRPYLAAKAGYSHFNTNLNIYDPDDFDHCEPVDTDVLYKDGTFVGAAGAGVMADLSMIFKRLEKGRLYIDGSVNVTRGGQVRYMNTDAPSHHHNGTPDGDLVTADFLNTQTQVVHKHHVGYVYKSPVEMLDFRFGVTINIAR